MSVIAVGVDASEGAAVALRFALEEGELGKVTLRVVRARLLGSVGQQVAYHAGCPAVLVRREKGGGW